MIESEEDIEKAESGIQEVKFSEEPSLGGVISEKKLLSNIGVRPVQNLERELQIACGFDKLGFLCGFKFTSSFQKQTGKKFFVVFVPKLKTSFMFRQHKRGLSSWYVWEWNSTTDVNVLSQPKTLEKFGFDIDLFFKSDYFKQAIPKFIAVAKQALAANGPIAAELKRIQDGGQSTNELKRYIKSIEDSLVILKTGQASSMFNLGNSSDGVAKIYRANTSYELDHFQQRDKEEKQQKKRNEFLAWMAARNKSIADAKKDAGQPDANSAPSEES